MIGAMTKNNHCPGAVLMLTVVLSRPLTHPIRRLAGIVSVASLAKFSTFTGEFAKKCRGDEIGGRATSVAGLALSVRAAIVRLQKRPSVFMFVKAQTLRAPSVMKIN